MENIVKEIESGIKNTEKKVGNFFSTLEKNFESNEAKLLAINIKSQKLTDEVEKLQANPTVQAIEEMVGDGYGVVVGNKIVSLIVAGNNAIHTLDTQKNLDAVNGTLVMLGARISEALGEAAGIVATIGEYLISFQKKFNLE